MISGIVYINLGQTRACTGMASLLGCYTGGRDAFGCERRLTYTGITVLAIFYFLCRLNFGPLIHLKVLLDFSSLSRLGNCSFCLLVYVSPFTCSYLLLACCTVHHVPCHFSPCHGLFLGIDALQNLVLAFLWHCRHIYKSQSTKKVICSWPFIFIYFYFILF
ncbi:hypothetical protein BDZ91DRAFT_433438 [Kalaharituber pfeilii]|nr:hypothetical protein BDZ91DRAFT_433438 [Kalaharituber pfeilii]